MPAVRFKSFSLQTQATQKVQPKMVDPALNHVIVIDVSGSMYGDLPELRRQLKNKLVSLVKDGDTVTMIWFSGRDQYGVLLEGEPVRSLTDLTKMHKAIDRFLIPVGMTGFKQPLEEVAQVIGRLSKTSNNPFSLFFMTDGYDNQWRKEEILKAARVLESQLVNATFVEYGWNCNRPLISEMATAIGGNHIFSENLSAYQMTFEKELSKRSGGKKVEVRLSTPAAHGFVFGLDSKGSLLTFQVEGTTVRVPETLKEIHYFSRTLDGGKLPAKGETAPTQVYAGLAVLSQRMMTEEIFEILEDLGDVRLINKFVNCFSKQDYSDFETLCMEGAVSEAGQFVAGRNTSLVPAPDAYTVLDVIQELASDDGNLMYPLSPLFEYTRIGAKAVDAADTLTEKEMDEIAAKMKTAKKADDLTAITEEIEKLQASKVKVNFEIADKDRGYPISGVVFNSDRPNVSVRFKFDGTVKLPENEHKKLPKELDSFIYRTYTIIRDGIVHTRMLPVSLTKATFDKFKANGLLQGESYRAGKIYSLDLSGTPVINRQMVQSVTAKDLCSKMWKLYQLKAEQKVFNDEFKSGFERVSESFELLYGAPAADWLKEIGVTDYNGFHPKTVKGDFADVYMAKFLYTDAKGLSSLPKVADARDAMKAGARTPKISAWIMFDAIKRIDEFKASPVYTKSKDQVGLLGNWIDGERKEITKQTRELMVEIAKLKFAVIVGHVWFKDLGSMDNTTFSLDVGYGAPVVFNLNLVEEEIGGKKKDD